MNNQRKQQLAAFLEDKGFYMTLALCAAAIGISGYLLFFSGDPASQVPVVVTDPEELTAPGPDRMEDDPAVSLPADPAPSLPTLEQPPAPDVPAMNPAKPARVAPVEGAVLRAFSGDRLVYDRTMGDWRTHNGTDYASQAGSPVLAVCDGTVGALWNDELRGACVRLDCGDKTYVTYCGLAPNDELVPGMAIKAGQQIGRVGASMLTESLEEPHLHIEVVKNGGYQDPEQYLK